MDSAVSVILNEILSVSSECLVLSPKKKAEVTVLRGIILPEIKNVFLSYPLEENTFPRMNPA
jgi:hypothetical protein